MTAPNAADAAAPCEQVSDTVSEQHLLVHVQDPLPEPQSQSDAQDVESERQRRLGSFELLDAAMDNVVEHDGNDDVDEHVIVEVQSFTAAPIEHAEQSSAVDGNAGELTNFASNAAAVQDNGLVSDAPDEVVSASVNTSLQAPPMLTFIESEEAEAAESNAANDVVVPTAQATAGHLPSSTLPEPARTIGHFVPGAAPRSTQEAVAIFEKCEPELLQWMQACQATDHGLPASHDDMLFFIESKYPELLENVAMLFEWMAHFVAIYNQVDVPSVLPGSDASGVKQLSRYSNEFKLSAIQRLDETGNLTEVAHEFSLKSTMTLVYWKYQRDETGQLLPARGQLGDQGRKAGFAQEQELLEWVLSHRETPITKQDIFNYMVTAYPEYASTRSPAALKMWIARFLKRHLAPGMASSSKDLLTALPVGDGEAEPEPAGDLAQSAVATSMRVPEPVVSASPRADAAKPHARPSNASATGTQTKRREKRGCPEGYVLHSNEFKLNALRKLDEGKTMSEVTEELGLKSQNTLAYWNSIRDKLATSEKKRFRLAGGGRRSSCTFEDELLTWVTDRHQKGQGTDVKAVLDYMRESHSSFTDGKKEPTLRKWILRFFKRCWRAPTATSGSSTDADKAHIFV